MTLQQCRYIVEVSKHKSISKAAEALFVTQPSISKAIRDLEDDLGITILDRCNKGVTFTKEGTELLFFAKMLMEQTESIAYHFRKQRDAEFETISISSQHYGFAIEAVAKLMDYLNEHRYVITIREGKTTDVIEEVYSGKSMLGILSISNMNRENFERYFLSKSLVFTPLLLIRQHVFLRKEHPLAGLKSIAIEQLRDFPYMTYHKDDIPLYFAEEIVDTNSIEKLVYLKDRGAMNNLLSNTDGYNIGTGCIVENYMNSNIISIPMEGQNEIQVGWVKRYDQMLSEKALVYIEILTTVLHKAAPKDFKK